MMESTQNVSKTTVSVPQEKGKSKQANHTKKPALDQIVPSKGESLGSRGERLLDDPLANFETGGSNGGSGIFSGVDFFEPGIAYISLEVSEAVAKSGMRLIQTEGYLRSEEMNDFLDENQEYAENDKKSIEMQALGSLIGGVIGVVGCGVTFVKLGFDVKGSRPGEQRVDDLNQQISDKTERLKNPTLTVEKAEASVGEVEEAASKEEANDNEADLVVEAEGEPAKEEAATQATNQPSDDQTRDEIKSLKSQLTAETNRNSAYWNKKMPVNNALQQGIQAFGQIGKAGADAGQSHYAYLRDMSGGLKQTDQQLYDALNTTMQQTTQYTSQTIQQANQNYSTVASMALQLA